MLEVASQRKTDWTLIAMAMMMMAFLIFMLIYEVKSQVKHQQATLATIQVEGSGEQYVLEAVSPWKDDDRELTLTTLSSRFSSGQLAGEEEAFWLLGHREQIPESWKQRRYWFPGKHYRIGGDEGYILRLVEEKSGWGNWVLQIVRFETLLPADYDLRVIIRK